MRPTPGELAEGMRAMLRAAGGELQSEGARAQVRRIMYVLKGARWDDAAFDLLRENDLIRSGLQSIVGDRSEHRALLAERPVPRDFAEANERNLALRTALASALDELRGEGLAETAERRRGLALKFLDRP